MKTVFIVDDDGTNLMLAKTALDGVYKTYAMESAAMMFRLTEKIMPDLILLDINMPEMDGFQAIEILKKNGKLQSIPVIFLTGRNDSETALRGLELGAADYIIKPFSRPVLIKRIELQLNAQTRPLSVVPDGKEKYEYSIPDNAYIKFKKGSYVTVEDKRVPDQFYLIMEGNISLSNELLLSILNKSEKLGPGDCFGIISAMSGYGQIETAVADTDVILLPIKTGNFEMLVQNNSQLVNKLILEFSKRMRYLNELLAYQTVYKKRNTKTSQIFFVAEYYFNQKQFDIALYAFKKFIEYFPEDEHVTYAQKRIDIISPYVTNELPYSKGDDLSRIYKENTMIFSEDEQGEDIYFIKSGMVKITKVANNVEILLAILNKGEIFGEMALIESKKRSTNAIAYEETKIAVISQTNFENIIKTQPALISNIITNLAKRLWVAYINIANTQITNPLGRMVDMLFIQLEKKHVNVNMESMYTFDFGPKELINMVGLNVTEGNEVAEKLLKLKYIELIKGKIAINDMFEFFKHANFFRTKR